MNAPAFLRFTLVRYGLAVVLMLAAVALRWALVPIMGLNIPYVTIFPAMMLAAITLGAGPGVLAAVLGVLMVEYYFMLPVGIEWNLAFTIRAAILLLTSLYVGWVSQRLRDARTRADAEATAARAAEAALRQQVELIDAARAEIIVREMQRVVRERQPEAAAAGPPGEALRRVPDVAGYLVAGVGVLVVAGWVFRLDALRSVVPGMTTMKVNTALCFLLAGAALALRERRALRLACAAVMGACAGLSLAEYVSGADLGIDQFLFRDPGDPHTVPGRMAQITALCFILAGLSLLLVGARARASLYVQQAAALAAGMIGLVALLGYAYGVPQLYGPAGFSNMALNTAAALAVLGAGLLCARLDGLVGVLMTPGPGAQLAWRLLPGAVLLPALVGWLRVQGSKAGLFEPNLGTSLFAITMILAFSALVWLTARTLDRADAMRRTTETQLRNQTELMDHAREALIVRELGGAIRFWNRGAEALYGWPAAEASGQRTHVLLRTEGVPVGEMDAQLDRTGHWEGELLHAARDGRRVMVESRQTGTRAGDGRLLVLESNRDITARKQAEEALQKTAAELARSNRDLEQFAYVASHDLQEPLRAVGGYVQLLQTRFADKLDEKGLQYIAGATEGAARMQKLVHDLLAFSRVARHEQTLEPADLNTVFAQAVSNLRGTIREAGAQVTCDPLPTLRVEAPLMVQVLQNLIGNAIKFRREPPPEIHVSARRNEHPQSGTPASGWLLAVRDNGLGIDPQYFERIFQIFQRLHTRRQFPGTGIGLAICKKIVERHGGRIWVESQPGQGSTFFFTIPDQTA